MALDVMYQLGTALHRNLYDLSLLRKVRLAVPVIGVGNLSFGGSGKTLVTEAIARHLATEGKLVGVVCRSYGAEPGPHILSDDNCDPYVVGDEAAMMSEERPEARMIIASGRDKTLAAQALIDRHPEIDVIVVDDAFQHHRIHQDVRIVIWPKPGALLRDFLTAADRADILLVPNGLRSPRPERETVYFVKVAEIAEMGTESDILTNARPPGLVGDSILLVAGLGPESDFFLHARKILARHERRLTECVLPDHVDYRRPEIQARLATEATGCDTILTTAKDAVKLRRLVIPLPPIYVVRVGIRLLTNDQMFWQKIRSVIM